MDLAVVVAAIIAYLVGYILGYSFGSRAGQEYVINEILKKAAEVERQKRINALNPPEE